MELLLVPEESAVQAAAVQQKQKAVTRYYDEYPSSTDVDVYQPEWSERFLQCCRTSNRVEHSTKVADVVSNSTLKDLDWDVFFSANPVAAVALWKLLQASYQLDAVICSISQEAAQSREAAQAVRDWQNMKPFEYLSSSGVEARWRKSLKGLHHQFEIHLDDEDEDEKVHRMSEVRCSVDALETAWKELQTSWAINLHGYPSKDLMLAQIRGAITWRFSALNNAMRHYTARDQTMTERERTLRNNSERSQRNVDDAQPRVIQRRDSWPVRVLRASENKEKILLLFLMVIFAYASLKWGSETGIIHVEL